MSPETPNLLINSEARVITFRPGQKYAGVISKRGPRNPYRTTGEREKLALGRNREVSSYIGKILETETLSSLSFGRKELPKGSRLEEAMSGVIETLKPITWKTYNRVHNFARFYQELTDPPKPDFLGGDGIYEPTDPDLRQLFLEIKSLYGYDFNSKFYNIPIVGNDIHPSFRYYVEGALALGRLATEDLPFNNIGQFLPDVWVNNASGTHITQFDGVVVPSDYKCSDDDDFDYHNYLLKKRPSGLIQVKTPLRPRFLSGMRKIKNPFPRDIAETQDQLGRMIIENGLDEFSFPEFVIFYYIRGVQPPVTHIVHFDSQSLKYWHDVLEENYLYGYFLDHNARNYNPQDSVNIPRLLGVLKSVANSREETLTIKHPQATEVINDLHQGDVFSDMSDDAFNADTTPLFKISDIKSENIGRQPRKNSEKGSTINIFPTGGARH
jgi:hypothetical protein